MPLERTLRNFVEVLFHRSGKPVIQQLGKTALQALRNDIANFLCIKTLIFQSDITTILNGRDNGCISRGTTNTALLQLADQLGFAVPRCGLGEVLGGLKRL